MGLRWLQATPVSHTLLKIQVKPNLLTENETRQRLAPSFFPEGEKQTVLWIQVWRDHLLWQMQKEAPLPDGN